MSGSLQFISTFIGLLGLSLGCALCVRALRRRSNDRKCIAGLLIVQVTWFCAILAAEFWRKKYGEDTLPLVARFATLALALIALIVSLGGVREMSPRRRHRHRARHGRRRGWLGAAMSACLFVLTGLGIYRTLVPAAVLTLAPAGKAIVMENLNFRFTPPKPWAQLDPSKLDVASTLAFRRTNPAMVFHIIGENRGLQSTLTVAGLAELARAKLKSSALSTKFEEEHHFSQQGQSVIEMAATAEFRDEERFYLFRLIVHHGCCYQLICSGVAADRAEIEREAGEMFSAFEILHADDGGLS